ncbi:ADP-ribosylation factor-like protein 2 [Varroa jacobsoni]|uniref:ADP-ribosylation factor-like protein 2 n=1 Tax=Varroa destructor TaxID=109461 RepID=A0A7M7KPT1_VARDE|nr:ADP-ribosylation factor-like protein 2 [Varroa destructor]XP_022670140.1 ADP-ribosylation factor-like protein 2 [Varroa destructor]XP_022670141.1 ADP-ribosylation factor-like protein 2 [Varroa destructor]XP_022670142.1 ADP-ribosylation factor-like protein 2 [Varroa destructor]XP_022670143.1 ADP-ribosylation factor-like protein 2 [Varroa destructor]XP_022670145.1 ADP-ribosylation factor-like protein 2 [Varroa destructor]XP_022670146.1 ADP-ribosylation factor-like protein 2 [Varroa destructo
MVLLYILRKVRRKEHELRTLVLGLDNAGKTTLSKRLLGEPLDVIAATLGFNITTLEYRDYKINLWDVGGQTSLRCYWRNYFESTDSIVWVVDSADRRRLDDCATELHGLLQDERLLGATLLVLANKQDLPGALNCMDIAEHLRLESITSHHWRVFPCSAFTSEDSLLQAIDWMLDDVASRVLSLN